MGEWLCDMESDLTEHPEGELRHFTKELIFEYIAECADVIERELKALAGGAHHLAINDYSIENYNSTKNKGE